PISTDPAVPSQDFVSKIVNEDNPGSAISESSSTGVGFVKAKQLPALNITPHLSPVTQIAKPSAVLNVVEVKQTKTLSRESSESKVSEYKSSQWIVRVGAFDKKSNANKLVDDLKKLDFPAKKRAIKIQDRTVVRVWVGPYDNRKQAQRIKAQINKSLKQNAFVARAGQ
ncbi:MAG: DedD protein, partial [Parasphingorhabdus sp.]